MWPPCITAEADEHLQNWQWQRRLACIQMEIHLRTPATCQQIPSEARPWSAAAKGTEEPVPTPCNTAPATIKYDMANTLQLATKHTQPLMGIDEPLRSRWLFWSCRLHRCFKPNVKCHRFATIWWWWYDDDITHVDRPAGACENGFHLKDSCAVLGNNSHNKVFLWEHSVWWWHKQTQALERQKHQAASLQRHAKLEYRNVKNEVWCLPCALTPQACFLIWETVCFQWSL